MGGACSDDDVGHGFGGASGEGGVTSKGGATSGGTSGGVANGGRGGGGHGGCCVGPSGGAGAGGHPEGGGGEGGNAGGGGTESGGAGAMGGAGAGAGAEGGAGGAGDVAMLEWARENYRSFSQRTAQPEAISAEIFALCRLPTLPETEFTKSVHGKELYLLDWLNAEAQAGYAQKGAAEFPLGATIVKEKLVRNSSSGFDLAALGIMIKRAPGFDSLHGDWQFGYWEAASGMSSDAIACGSCHSGSKTDFVFLDESWRIPSP